MLAAALLLASVTAAAPPAAQRPFAVQVVDDATGRGVPLVELRTVDHVRYITDSAGWVAIREPALVDQKVYFHVRSHGYEFPKDGFGYRGKALQVAPGKTATLRIKRLNVAQRLYRVTGADIYRDSVLLGRGAPIAQPLVNAQVSGSDSVNSIVYRGRVYWFWGDTNRLAYPLGSFHVPGAISRLPDDGGPDPGRGVDLKYFTRDDGFVANTCEMPGDGPTWIDGPCVVRDDQGKEKMFAKYVKVRGFLDVYERGLVAWNDARKRFDKIATFDFDAPLYPRGHALLHESGGTKYVYFGNPYPTVRVPDNAAALASPSEYQGFTCLAAGSTLKRPRIDRDQQGAARWSWKRNTPPPGGHDQAAWLRKGLLKSDEAVLALRDVDDDKPVIAHAGSVAWNAFRRRYVMIVEEAEGTSNLGEIWYAEADTPLGPWVYARKIVTHDKYSFYNPRHHPMFDRDGGRTIFFEGTYSTFFSGNDNPTPRYDYNQIMYALDLGDQRVVLPVAVYQADVDGRQMLATRHAPVIAEASNANIAFMALDRPKEGALAIVRLTDERDRSQLAVRPVAPQLDAQRSATDQSVAFYALPTTVEAPPKSTVLLHAWKHKTSGRLRYAVAGQSPVGEYVRFDQPLCRVWRYPLSPDLRFDR